MNTQPDFRFSAMATMHSPISPIQGFTLIEVLVAVVVISLGLLGLAGLQVVSLNNNQTAYYRSLATQQTNDMMDRIRANLAGIGTGSYDNLSATIPADPGCFAAGCSVANMAVTDHFQWLTNTAAMLPGGSGTVRCIRGPAATCAANVTDANRVYDITVTWTARTEAGNAAQSFVTRFAP
jgi:type IV pilus assembly protein PilV